MLTRLRYLSSTANSKLDKLDGLLQKDGRMFYDIPAYFTAGKFSYKVNEEAPEDVKDFSLKGLSI